MKIAVLIFWALFSSLTTAVPTGEERYVNLYISVAINVFSNNQTEKVQGCSKSDQTQCFSGGINGTVSTNLIDCLDNQCICDECFTLNATSGQCTVTSPDCYFYNPGTGTCVDNRKSQLVAFLLSFFLSGFGVANFYIKRYDLAAGQLLVLLILIIGTALGICIPLCMCCCMHWRADTEAAVSYYVIIIHNYIHA